jgi:hypothetical protein
MAGKPITIIIAAVGLLCLAAAAVHAEEYKLPDVEELATLPPEAIKFYGAGIRSLDHIDYDGAYDSLSKASALQPAATRLNMIVAAVGLKHGRSKKASDAKPYYETVIAAYQNVLRVPGHSADFRRDVENRLRIAIDERDNLDQRDALREGRGGMFIMQFNREFAKPTSTPSSTARGPVPAAPTPTPVIAYPAAPVSPYGIQPPAYPYGQQPTGMPGMPGLPPPPGMPGAPGAPQPYDPAVGGMPPENLPI